MSYHFGQFMNKEVSTEIVPRGIKPSAAPLEEAKTAPVAVLDKTGNLVPSLIVVKPVPDATQIIPPEGMPSITSIPPSTSTSYFIPAVVGLGVLFLLLK